MTARPAFDLTLYLIVGSEAVGGRSVEDVAEAAVAGGVTLVQLREKAASTRAFIAHARALKVRLAPRGVPLIINDRVDVALAADADGVHLGQDDMPPDAARKLLGAGPLLGLSVGDLPEVPDVDPALVDYVGLGSVYPTTTKPDAGAAIGLERLRSLRAALSLPAVAIGGIDAANAADVICCGVQGVAVVSAICGAADPEAAARDLRRAVEAARAA